MSEPKWELNPYWRDQVRGGCSLNLGGGGVNEPDPVQFNQPSDADETLEGEEWGMYEGDFLVRADDPEVTEDDAEAAAAIAEAAEEEDDETAEDIPVSEAAAEGEEALPTSDEEETVSEEPEIEEPEETPIHSIDDVDEGELPDADELRGPSDEIDYTRDDLEDLARDLGVHGDVEGTGSNGYVLKEDLQEHLLSIVESIGSDGEGG